MRIEWILGGVLAVVALTIIIIFNRLVQGRNMVREAWSGIDVQLKRRSDLIPALVETVKGYAAHERKLFEDVAAIRSSAMTASSVPGKAAAETALQASVGKLLALSEAYPQLKADQNFLKLQTQMAELEDQLQMARRYYNGTVRDFNISTEVFPNILIARPFGFREQPYFQVDDASAATPSVSFPDKQS